MGKETEYHIGIAKGEIPEYVLLPGDPKRAKAIAERFFDNPELIADKREYLSYKGTYQGLPVAVCSTGIGCPSAAIAIEELIHVGCHTFIRVGTAGAINNSLTAGDLVIITGSVRDDGTSKQYVPVEFPAIANPLVVSKLEQAAKKYTDRYFLGIGHSKDAFYSEYPDKVADPDTTEKKWEMMRNSGVLATEMEAATLFVIGHLRGVRVGSICVIVGEPIEKEAKIIGKPDLGPLIHTALDSFVALQDSPD
ncbi:MAG: Uridine phosphorylase [Candidatus Thorarchaeota archaeon]|nr:MAG: Uridine phosphorylase [Candidatus Thorarchaeota archaeon]